MPPLALSDAEIDVLSNLSQPLPPSLRSAFLLAVGEELSHEPEHDVGLTFRLGCKWQKTFMQGVPGRTLSRPFRGA